MHRNTMSAVAAAIVTAAVLMVLDERDFDQVPATDTADVVATFAVLIGAIVWFVVRRIDPEKPALRLLGSIAAGVAIGALVIGLLSVVYDPWAP